jgi:uncharacterized protein YfaS (alpha-2-macroglobulin family)
LKRLGGFVFFTKFVFNPEITPDRLLQLYKNTTLGSLFWSDDKLSTSFFTPYSNSTEKTLEAYQRLKQTGGYEKELELIRNYFFEQRKDGSWRNTYESSRIIETILPDMLKSGTQYTETNLYINDKEINQFPHISNHLEDTILSVRKTGTMPLFFTAYQQTWNQQPKAIAGDFTVTSCFIQNNDTVDVLTAGQAVELNVRVNVASEAGYVMIDVPIPAGCTYESKENNHRSVEVHREYFKEKVSIFCQKLPKGEYSFAVKLMPRYTGLYHLNPAKAALMYYPVYFGREEIKETPVL